MTHSLRYSSWTFRTPGSSSYPDYVNLENIYKLWWNFVGLTDVGRRTQSLDSYTVSALTASIGRRRQDWLKE